MKIYVFNRQKDLPIKAAAVKSIVKEVFKNEGFKTDEISIYFVSKEEICRLHEDFFNDPSPTDCISFPLDEQDEEASGYHILGEIFVCPRAALEYDRENVYAETTLYLLHGLLHLLGYDDLELKHRRKMRAAEKKHMDLLANKKLLLKAS
jgi:probable rRNA maturation factor